MRALTPSERRGALIVVLLLALGAARDLLLAGRAGPAGRSGPAAGEHAARETLDAFAGPGGAERAPARPGPVDLNLATAADLDRLPGIGPVLASRILEHRRRFGPFAAPEELRAVRGVGPALLERLRPRIAVSTPAIPVPVVDSPPGGPAKARSRAVQSARRAPSGAADSAQVGPPSIR